MFTIPFSIGTLTVRDNAGGNFVVSCPGCRHEFDAAPVDGTYSGESGTLRLIAEYVASGGPERAQQLRSEAAEISAAGDAQRAEDLLRRMGWEPPTTMRNRLETMNLALDLVEKLVKILGVLLVAGVWTAENVQQAFEQWIR